MMVTLKSNCAGWQRLPGGRVQILRQETDVETMQAPMSSQRMARNFPWVNR